MVDHARDGWIRSLIDLSRRNNLLFFRSLKMGTLDLSGSNPEAMDSLMAGDSVPLRSFMPDADEAQLVAKAKEICNRAIANLEEKGLKTLFLSYGMASWPVADGGRPTEAPVLLFPTSVEVKGRDGRNVLLQIIAEPQVNLALLHVLEKDLGCTVTAETLLGSGNGQDDENTFDPANVLRRLRELTNEVGGFEITTRVVLGNFSFQKMAMVRDIQERGDEMASHDMIAAISGDPTARDAVQHDRIVLDPRELDLRRPDNEYLILDADSSQDQVIAAVLASQNGVINGPPGTGKSQTIANLIAALSAHGRRVLFVAEKRAALEVVLKRLREVGLGHLALDLHGADVSRREVMRQIADSLKLVRESIPLNVEDVHRHFEDRRALLKKHVERMHARRSPAGMSVYALQGRLLRIPEGAHSSVRWRGESLDRLDATRADAVELLLTEAGGFKGLFLWDDPSPWARAKLLDGRQVQGAVDCASGLARVGWPGFEKALSALSTASGLRTPGTLREAEDLVKLVEGVTGTLSQYREDIFEQDLEFLEGAMTPAAHGPLIAVWSWFVKSEYRRARRKLRQLRRERNARGPRLLVEARTAAGQLRRWRALRTGESSPRGTQELQNARVALNSLFTEIDKLAFYLGRDDLRGLQLDALGGLVRGLAQDAVTPYRLPRVWAIERELKNHGVEALVADLRTRKPDAELWLGAFEHAWLSSCLDRARWEDPELAGFNGSTHQQFVEEFCRLDRELLKLAAARVRRSHGERVIDTMNKHRDQAALVEREAAKKTRHLPLRRLFVEAPDVLAVVRPCWMASPLSVSQLIPSDRVYFDVVLFDEASQVLPEDAVCSILRARQSVVAGDQRQLPPTTFFVAGEDDLEGVDEVEVPPTAGFESVLDLMTGFLQPPWTLEWHYRSSDESLIAFSNRHIYRGSLITFPGPGGPPVVTHEMVPINAAQDGQEESAPLEVRRVAELVIQHASQRPDETLGVIALGIKHARRVEAAIEDAIKNRADLDEFFDQAKEERFFVKNLERVQGDERDAVILTIGAGKDRAGRVDYRQFGPLNGEGGERRLNVAVTRARRRMTLVSSFNHHDVDAERAKHGVRLLRLYLEYAASNGRHLSEDGETSIPLNPFELDVFDALSREGLDLAPQWGVSGYRIDMVAKHPKRPGQFVLAIECDGASYHSMPTVRDRDRLRQQHLERLGWRFLRIWSTDWFMRRDEEIARVRNAYDAALNAADRGSDGRATGVRGRNQSEDRGIRGSGNDARAPRRGPQPTVPRRTKIEEFKPRELDRLVAWIKSDGRLRTDEEIVEEMLELLGFERRGKNIEAGIRDAINRMR